MLLFDMDHLNIMSAPLNAHSKPRASMNPLPDIMSQSNDEDKDSHYNNDIRDDSLGNDALRDIDDTMAQPCSHTRGGLSYPAWTVHRKCLGKSFPSEIAARWSDYN